MADVTNIDTSLLDTFPGLTCEIFRCDDNLSKYIDSMLFDSHEDEIAYARFNRNGEQLCIKLEINGYVDVEFKGESYTTPSDFPDELIDRIKRDPNGWSVYASSGEENDETEGDINVIENNWFEFLLGYYVKESNIHVWQDGVMCDDDISIKTPQELFDDLVYIAADELGYTTA